MTDVIPSQTEREAASLAKTEGAAGRVRIVLRYPDLAARLCQQPLGYSEPGQWNGYIPPRECGGYNTSPQRRALVEICAEAFRR